MNHLTLKTLVVDDEIGIRLGVQRILCMHPTIDDLHGDTASFTVTTAETGRDALDLLKNEQFDLLILDHKLPDIQGLEILEHLAKDKIKTLTIMITAYASLDVAVSATKFGAFDFLAKPFTPDELISTVEKAIRHIALMKKAEQLEQEKKQVRFQFLSVLAHELKSPLAAVEGYLRIMDSKISGDSITSYDNAIQRSLCRIDGMRRMIMDLLDLTRIESGSKSRSIDKIDITHLSQNIIDGLRAIADKRMITIETFIDNTVPFLGDRGEIEIILNNLLSNAVKYNRDGGKVELSSRKDGSSLTIECKDTGIGMSEDDKARLFKEFSRIKNEKTKSIEGSGLGLSIVKKLVDLYDGSIAVTSEIDVGTTFRITLNENKGGPAKGNQ